MISTETFLKFIDKKKATFVAALPLAIYNWRIGYKARDYNYYPYYNQGPAKNYLPGKFWFPGNKMKNSPNNAYYNDTKGKIGVEIYQFIFQDIVCTFIPPI